MSKEHKHNSEQVRAYLGESGQKIIEGLCIVFGQQSVLQYDPETRRFFYETIAPDAVTEELLRDIFLCYQHDKAQVVASQRNDSLRLTKTERGVEFFATPNETSWGQDAYILLRDGVLKGCSFGFFEVDAKWELMGKVWRKTVTKITRITEVSLVMHPCYPATTAWADESLRSVMSEEDIPEIPEEEPADEGNTAITVEVEVKVDIPDNDNDEEPIGAPENNIESLRARYSIKDLHHE